MLKRVLLIVAALVLVSSPAWAIDVMLLHSDPGKISSIETALNTHPEITVTDIFDGTTGTPTAGDLAGIDAVYAHSDSPWNDNAGIGDVLADFADGGGGVALALGCFTATGGWEITGRLKSDGYIPLSSITGMGPSAVDLGDFDADHPIMFSVSSASSMWYGVATMSTGAELVASWDVVDEEYVVTQNNVVALNSIGNDEYTFGGDAGWIAAGSTYWSWAVSQPPEVTSIDPASSPSGSVVSVEIDGDFFIYNDTDVMLSGPDKADIAADNIVVDGYESITCDFDLDGAAAGTYDVVVTTTNGGDGTLDDGFTVTGDDDDDDDDDDQPPRLAVKDISKSIGTVSAIVENIGEEDLVNVSWSISVQSIRNRLVFKVDASESGNTDLEVDDEVTIKVDDVRGLGLVEITAEAETEDGLDNPSITQRGFVIGRLIILLKN